MANERFKKLSSGFEIDIESFDKNEIKDNVQIALVNQNSVIETDGEKEFILPVYSCRGKKNYADKYKISAGPESDSLFIYEKVEHPKYEKLFRPFEIIYNVKYIIPEEKEKE